MANLPNEKFLEFFKLKFLGISRISQFEKLTYFRGFFLMWKTIEIPKIVRFFRNYLKHKIFNNF